MTAAVEPDGDPAENGLVDDQAKLQRLIALVALVAAFAAVTALRVPTLLAGTPTQAERIAQMRTPEELARTFTYEAVAPADQAAVATAVAAARPEAQRLIDLVDGRTTIRVAPLDGRSVGETRPVGDRYDVVLDLGVVRQEYGQRGITRLVLHELGHVIDDAMLTDPLRAKFDAGIPAGSPCAAGVSEGSCAPIYERFAESFAKWATGDIGVDLYLGYKVPPPALEDWGRPLAALGA